MNATSRKPLKFRRERAGTYFASDARFRFTVYRDEESGRWFLEVRELKHLPELREGRRVVVKAMSHAIGQPVVDQLDLDSKNAAVAVATAYSEFENPYEGHLHGHMNRLTAATTVAYDRLRDAR